MLNELFLSLAQSAEQTRPDIMIFLLDDVGFEDVEGLPTPSIDGLAARGIRFTRGYTHAWCAPTRDSLFRGVWDGTYHGDLCGVTEPTSLDTTGPSLPKMLDALGYETTLVGKYHLGVPTLPTADFWLGPYLLGFDHWLAGPSTSVIGGCIPVGSQIDDGVISNDARYETERQRDAILDSYQLAKLEGKPFFGVVAFTDAHFPWNFPPAHLMPPGYETPLNPTERDRFEAEILALDVAIGDIVDGLDPDTWVILLGDNGTPRMVAPRPKHAKKSVFEDGVHVPFIVSGPGLQRRDSDALVHAVDIFPTLADALGVPTPKLDGESFLGALCGGPGRRPWVFVHNPGKERAVVSRQWKLREALGVESLYDLETDPHERNPLPPVGRVADLLRGILATMP